MGVYSRFKQRGAEGFRALVELLETTPIERRQRMIDVGREEDPKFTELALQHMMTFEDIIGLPDMEMAELMAEAPPRVLASAIQALSPEIQQRFLKNARGPRMSEVRDFMDGPKATLREIGGAQLKLIEYARKLEKRGLIRAKKLPAT